MGSHLVSEGLTMRHASMTRLTTEEIERTEEDHTDTRVSTR